jgi:hypothetical protein
MARPLALDIAPHGEATGWRAGEQHIDALAYIDPLTEEEKAEVNKLIEDEVCFSPPERLGRCCLEVGKGILTGRLWCTQLRNSVKRPQDFLKELPALPPLHFEVTADCLAENSLLCKDLCK